MSSCIENTVALVKDNIGRVVVGKTDAIELLLVALICEGHVLLRMSRVLAKRCWRKRWRALSDAASTASSSHRTYFPPM